MTASTHLTTSRSAARVAGLGYAALFVLAVFANFVVRLGLVDMDNPAATVANLSEQETLFRFGLAAFVVVFLIDVAVAWALYVLLRPAGADRSLAAAWFRLVHTAFLGVGVTSLFLALQFATGGPLVAGLDEAQRASWTMLALELFNYTWLIGLAAFGLHLILVGRLLGSGLGPRLLGPILAVAGGAYVVDTFAYTLLADYAAYEDLFLTLVAVPSVLAELAFTVWLLRQGWSRTDPQQGPPSTPAAARPQPAMASR